MPAFTEKFVADAPAGKHWDTKVPGFGLHVTARGRRFFFRYRDKGRKARELTIGTASEFKVETARDKARAFAQQVREGNSPAEEKRHEVAQARGGAFGLIVDEYLAVRAPTFKATSRGEVERLAAGYIKPLFGKLSLDACRALAIQKIHNGLVASEDNPDGISPIYARRVVEWCRTIWEWAAEKELLGANCDRRNPFAAVDFQAKPRVRKRSISDREYRQLGEGLRAERSRTGSRKINLNYIEFCILVAARRSEPLTLRWEDIKPAGVIEQKAHKSDRHQGEPLRYVITPAVRNLLDRMRDDHPESEWMFPKSFDPTEHLGDVNHTWLTVRKKAGVPEMVFHDFRRGFTRIAQSLGIPKEVRVSLLGHMPGDMHDKHYDAVLPEVRAAAAGAVNAVQAALLRGDVVSYGTTATAAPRQDTPQDRPADSEPARRS